MAENNTTEPTTTLEEEVKQTTLKGLRDSFPNPPRANVAIVTAPAASEEPRVIQTWPEPQKLPGSTAATRKLEQARTEARRLEAELASAREQDRQKAFELSLLPERYQTTKRRLTILENRLGELNESALTEQLVNLYDKIKWSPANDMSVREDVQALNSVGTRLANRKVFVAHVKRQIEEVEAELKAVEAQAADLAQQLGLEVPDLTKSNAPVDEAREKMLRDARESRQRPARELPQPMRDVVIGSDGVPRPASPAGWENNASSAPKRKVVTGSDLGIRNS